MGIIRKPWCTLIIMGHLCYDRGVCQEITHPTRVAQGHHTYIRVEVYDPLLDCFNLLLPLGSVLKCIRQGRFGSSQPVRKQEVQVGELLPLNLPSEFHQYRGRQMPYNHSSCHSGTTQCRSKCGQWHIPQAGREAGWRPTLVQLERLQPREREARGNRTISRWGQAIRPPAQYT